MFLLPLYLFIFSVEEDTSEGPFRVRYEVTDVPINLPSQKPPADKPNPKQGIGKSLVSLLLYSLGCVRVQ